MIARAVRFFLDIGKHFPLPAQGNFGVRLTNLKFLSRHIPHSRSRRIWRARDMDLGALRQARRHRARHRSVAGPWQRILRMAALAGNGLDGEGAVLLRRR
jgi:hypothetical protein